ncbi:glycyl-radical enzyme activating protein [Floccifex porci]|uniref:Glycyl-radical enzyme activating protein n=1 Tax=Floccifex porci TaxID=2606629 RepID=A0A7X2N2R3_9FIRM|nr:glycyl-radical enzyme activating protein [Floccifex porci]MSS01361.1 glycyl-radical enzyme activating protein [Floccifex porci]
MIKVSNIERFATHDGPGIRTTIFLKGCPLHCPWCANPETWTLDTILMHDEKKCVRCHCCQKVCEKMAIDFDPDFKINRNLCDGCQKCMDVCIPEAISFSGKEMTIDEILEEISKDDAYYKNSNGGITLSGGEPLFQFEEVFKLIQILKEKGYHIAIEITGMYNLNVLKKVEPYIDLFLHDIKHLNKEKLESITGASKEIIFNNLDYLSKTCKEKVIIRTPVIPGFNEEIVKDIILYAKEKGFKEVNLLPYHSLGKNKWHNLKKDYVYENEKMMDKSHLSSYTELGKELNICVKIGG